jgi:hypothetical protein
MAKLKIGDSLLAPKDIIAFKMDDVTVTLFFLKGQKIGVIKNIGSGYISFLSSYDDGWGGSEDAEFYVYSSDFDIKENTDTTTKKNPTGGTKTTVDEINDILTKTTEQTQTNKKEPSKETAEPESSTILGLSTGTFFGIVGVFLFLILLVVVFSKSDTPKVIYQQSQPQSQPQTLSGVEVKKEKNVIPKFNFIQS